MRDNRNPNSYSDQSLGSILRDIGASAKDLIQSEIEIFKIEIKDSFEKLAKHSAQMAVFGTMAAKSLIPFMAFLVLGLIELFGLSYWLSSLIVAVVFALIGGSLAYSAFLKMKNEDVNLTHTKNAFHREVDSLKDKINEIKQSTKRRTV